MTGDAATSEAASRPAAARFDRPLDRLDAIVPKPAAWAFAFSNLSPVSPDAAEHERLKRISAELRDLLARKGLSTVVSVDPVKDAVAKSAYTSADLRRCNGCARPSPVTPGRMPRSPARSRRSRT